MRPGNTIAVVAAHPDDEVLGCGGTIARMAAEGSSVHILLIADGETSRRTATDPGPAEQRLAARTAAAQAACGILQARDVNILGLADNRLDGIELLQIVRQIEDFVQRHQPSVVLTHNGSDVNIDHRVVHDAVISACRPLPGHPVKEILFFEVPSSTEWRPPASLQPFSPNYFVDIGAALPRKLEALRAYAEELRAFPHPRSPEAVSALARWRGATVGVAAAEAFVLGRRLLDQSR